MKPCARIFIISWLIFFVALGNVQRSVAAISATIKGSTSVCIVAVPNPIITFTGIGGTAPYTFTFKLNNGSDQTIATAPGVNTVTLNAPTNAEGAFSYTLVKVSDKDGSVDQADTATVTIEALPVVDFNFVDNQCSGSPVKFTSTVSGGSGLTYLWNFGDGQTSTDKDPSHLFTASGSGTQSFSVSLTVKSSLGCATLKTKSINLIKAPNATLNGTGSGEVFNGTPVFKICSNAVSTFAFTNASTTTATNTNYRINWGDGTPDFTATTWTATNHTYQIGLWNLTYTIDGPDGCSMVKPYIVFVGSNPAVSLGNPGNTDICIQNTLTFPITGTSNNPPGTTYMVTFNDGSSSQTFTHPPPAEVVHKFLKSSCGTISSNGTFSFPDSFSANIVASNPCGQSAVGVVPIYVSSPPIADFVAPTLPSCTNATVCINSTTKEATQASSSGCKKPNVVWSFTPSVGITLSSGSLGNDFGSADQSLWVSGSDTICPKFSIPGIYTITMKIGNRCGVDQKIKTICIEPPFKPSFIVDNATGCAPLKVATTNLTDLSKSCSPATYLWSVTYAAGYCGTVNGATFTNGTTKSSANPSFNFANPGTYSIKLSMSNSCAGSKDTTLKVIVKKPPTVTINPIANACGSATITPVAVVNSCAPITSALTYAWSFPGGTPATSIDPSPSKVTYSATGKYTISLMLTNECGVSTTATQTFSVNKIPHLTNKVLSQTICSGSPTELVTLTSDTVGTTYSWTAKASAGITGFLPSGNTNTLPIRTLTTTSNSVGQVDFTITPSYSGCADTVTHYVVTVNPAPAFTNQPVSSNICKDGTPATLSVAFKNGDGAPNYQWFSNSANNYASGTPIVGETKPTYDPPGTTLGTIYYYCVVTLPSGICANITSQIASVTVNPPPTISTQPTATQSLCVGGTLATPLTVSYTGGTGVATYQWFSNTTNSTVGGVSIPGETKSTFTPPVFTLAGNYYYYAELTFAGNGCGSSATNVAEVEVVNDPTLSKPLPSQSLCQGSNADTLKVVASGGIGVFAYQWYRNTTNNTSSGTLVGGATNAEYVPLTNAVGTTYYYCKITQPNGLHCDATSDTAKVIVKSAATFNKQPISSTVCVGGTPTRLEVSFVNGVGTPTYQWYKNTTNAIVGGSAMLTETNATFDPPAAVADTLFYYCIVTLPSGGCSSLTSNIAQVQVNANPILSANNYTICSGNPFHYVPNAGDVVPVGITYTWSKPTVSPLNSISGATAQSIPQTDISQKLINLTTLPATVTYTVIPKSGVCAGNSFNVVVTVNPAINAVRVLKNSTCFGASNGSIQNTITGGIPFTTGDPYQITWTSANGFSSTVSSISGLAPGIYNLSITDQGGCPFSRNDTITEPKDIIIKRDTVKNVTCFAASNGEIAISISGGTPPYKYSWTKDNLPYATIEDVSNLGSGNYSVTVTDAQNCVSKISSFTVLEPPILAVKLISQTNVLCFGDASGTITVNALGGTPIEKPIGVFDYQYAWKGANGFTSNTQNLSNILAGTYDLTVTDAYGCTATMKVVITQTPEIKIDATVVQMSCYDSNNASIDVHLSGGVSPYQIEWSHFGVGLLQENLSAGNYLITVTDAIGCKKTRTIVITEPPKFTINPIIKHVTCFGAKDGSINLNFVGGVAPVKLVWSDGAITGVNRNNIGPGTYMVAISDGTPCFINRTFTIIEPQQLVLSANIKQALDCNDANSGAINLMVTGGVPPYAYKWSNGATTEDLTAIPGGNYLITVTDSVGCMQTMQYVVTRPQPINISVTETNDYNCATKVFKKIYTAHLTGGLPPYKFVWSSGVVSGANNEKMETEQSGLIVLQATDGLGCTGSLSFNVDIPKLGISSLIMDCNTHSYQFDAILSNNLVINTYSWKFGDGSTSTLKNPQHRFANAGIYNVQLVVTNSFCTSSYQETIVVELPPVLTIDKKPIFCIGDSIVIRVSGANSYLWSDGSLSDSLLIKQKGDYSVVGTSKAGCTSNFGFTATHFDLQNYTLKTDKEDVSTSNPVLHTWSENNPFSSYLWDFGDGKSAQGSDIYHTYDITKEGYYDIKLQVTNPDGCLENATKRIWITNTTKNNTFTPNGDGVNEVFMKEWKVKIYNRNGVLIFEGNDGWDGTCYGKPAANDTYFYVLYYISGTGTKTKEGFITLIR